MRTDPWASIVAAAEHSLHIPLPNGRAGTLLVLDDDPASCELIEAAAEYAGFMVRTTSDPIAFLRLYDDWHPSHITLDVHLDTLDGVEVIRTLAQRHCLASITIVSGAERRVREAVGRVAAEHGLALNGVLPKPFDYRQLAALLRAPGTPRIARFHADSAPAAASPTADELRAALSHDEFVPYYQPQVDLRSGRVYGFEVLARWRHPTQGILPPSAFLEQIEQERQSCRLTQSLLEQALCWMASADIPADSTLCVNLSPTELDAPDLVEGLVVACRANGIPPGRLMLEITESAALNDTPAILAALTRLRIYGFKLAIDDIGIGFSSLGRLLRQPFNALKLERSFVIAMDGSTEARAVVSSLLELGKSLGLDTIAEGVETDANIEWLQQAGCSIAQGFRIARPMPGDRCLEWLAGWQPATIERFGSGVRSGLASQRESRP